MSDNRQVREGEALLSAIKRALEEDAATPAEDREDDFHYRQAMMDLVRAFEAATVEVADRQNFARRYEQY